MIKYQIEDSFWIRSYTCNYNLRYNAGDIEQVDG